MRVLATPQKDELDMSRLSVDERALVRRELKTLGEGENSELETGKRLFDLRSAVEKYGQVARLVGNLPFTPRTAYRRIKTYERALEIWTPEIIDAAIKRKMVLVGWSDAKPMGVYEDIAVPKKPFEVEEFLDQAEMTARRSAAPVSRIDKLDTYERLKHCFRSVEQATADLTPKERETFMQDLIGMEMSLLGTSDTQKFTKTAIPGDFWPITNGSKKMSAEGRERISRGALKRWARIRAAK